MQRLIAVVRDILHHNGAIRWVRVAVDDDANFPGRGRIELAGVCVRDRFPREVHLRVADLGIVEIVGCEISYGSELFGNGNANGLINLKKKLVPSHSRLCNQQSQRRSSSQREGGLLAETDSQWHVIHSTITFVSLMTVCRRAFSWSGSSRCTCAPFGCAPGAATNGRTKNVMTPLIFSAATGSFACTNCAFAVRRLVAVTL